MSRKELSGTGADIDAISVTEVRKRRKTIWYHRGVVLDSVDRIHYPVTAKFVF